MTKIEKDEDDLSIAKINATKSTDLAKATQMALRRC